MTQVLTKKPRKGRIKPAEPVAAQLVSDAKGKKPVIQYASGERAEVSRDSDEYLLLSAEQELLERELQRRRLLPFVQKMNPKYTAGWAHELLARRLEKFLQDVLDKKSPRLMVTFPPRHGKQVADETPVLTVKGWKTHGELQVGDEVFHPTGRPVKVLALSDKTPSDWVVELSNGAQVRCHGNHEWTVYDRARRAVFTRETRWFVEPTRFGKPRAVTSGGRCTYQLPGTHTLEFPTAELPLHPYVLGAWLGDGSRGKGCITHAAEDVAVADRVEALGYPRSSVCVHKTTGVVTTYFSGPRPNVTGRLLGELRAAGVTPAKHIPEAYLRASIEQRLQLLAGLVDTDGHVDSNSRVRITTADEALARGIVDLCTTLGFRPYQRREEPTLSSSGIQGRQVYYVVGFQPTCPIPCVLARKQIQRFAPQRAVGVERVYHDPVGAQGHCIQVDSPDGLYLVGKELIPTHNSELTSRNFPAWALGKYPWMEFILASYGMSLAEKFSRDVLDRIRDPHYGLLFPDMQLKTESADQWSTTSGGGLRAAGARVGVTGMGAHILVIDDPFRDQKDADSDTIRNDTWDWYTTTAMTRLAPGGGVLIINTRWHDDDLSGRLLERMNEDEEFERFDCIDFPAIAEEDEYLSMDDRIVYAPEPGARLLRHKGDAMHPVRYGLKQLNAIKRVLHPRHWNALYQQKPVPDDGEFFSRNQFIEIDYGPSLLDGKAYIVCDFAISEKKLSDWTVIGAALHMPNDTIHLDDVDRFRSGDSARIVRSMVAMLKRYGAYNPILVVEDGQIWKSIASLFAAECRRERIYPVLQVMYALTDKAARATPLQGRMQMHMVTFKKGAPWFEALQNEFLRFPVGKHDDQVDMLAWAAQAILGKTPPRAKNAAQRGGKRLSVEQQLRKLMREQQHAVHDHMSA